MKGLDLMGRIVMVRIDKHCCTIGHLMQRWCPPVSSVMF